MGAPVTATATGSPPAMPTTAASARRARPRARCASRSSGRGSSRDRRASSTPTRSTATGGSSRRSGPPGSSVGVPRPHDACPAGSARTSGASSTSAWPGGCWPAHVDRVAETFGDLVDGWITVPRAGAVRARRAGCSGACRRVAHDADDARRGPAHCCSAADAEAARLLARPGGAPVASLRSGCRRSSPLDADRRSAAHAARGGRRAGVVSRGSGAATTTTSSACRAGTRVGVAADGSVPARGPATRGGCDGLGGLARRRRRDAAPRRRGAPRPAPAADERGVWDDDDERRATRSTAAASRRPSHEAVADGVTVQHVHWWSAIDGYEGWAGFAVRSGLFDRDREPAAIDASTFRLAPPPVYRRRACGHVAAAVGGLRRRRRPC